jgi:acetolactate synthase I/II/III large subunit
VANAFRNQTPLLVIGGQTPRRQFLMGGLQELDHTAIMKPITKLSFAILDTDRIPELLGMAFREAYNGRPGPVFVEIPMDVLNDCAATDDVVFPKRYRSKGQMSGHPDLIEQAADLLQKAARPVILAGTQVWHCRAVTELNEFVRKSHIPVYLNGAARGCMAPDSPYFLSRSRRQALAEADAVLVIGTPFDFRLSYGKRIGPETKIVQVDLDFGELGHNRDIHIGIQGDAGCVLAQLTAASSASRQAPSWLAELRRIEVDCYERDRPYLYSEAIPIHPLRLAREIQEFMHEDSVFIADGGDVVTMSASTINPRKAGRWLDPGPLGTLGVGTPFAIAAKAALPGSEVIILFGDGAFGLTGFDYDTLVRFNMPVIGIVGNNAAWNQVRFGQREKYGREKGDVANLLTALRYDKIVEAMGGHGEFVTEPSQIRPALERSRTAGKPSLINVILERDIFSAGTMNQTMYK